MKSLTNKQLDFLKKEFNIVKIDYSDSKALEEIRMKCFDIETDEAYDRFQSGSDDSSIGERGDMAVSIIDDLYDIIKA